MAKSPFPGMDPYLEQAWRDVHLKLCAYSADDLQVQLGAGLFARVDERLVVEESSLTKRSVHGDVEIVRRRNPRATVTAVTPAAGVALAEPITVEYADEQATEGFIEIIDARTGGKVITVIEFLSLTNKLPGPGRQQYQQKRTELETAGVSLVEINLLRTGPFIGVFPETALDPENRTPYHAIVHRGWVGRRYEYYPMPLADRLPAIGIPLRQTDPIIALDIQSLIDRVYRNGAYDQEIDYEREPQPAFEGQAAIWADKVMKEAGVR